MILVTSFCFTVLLQYRFGLSTQRALSASARVNVDTDDTTDGMCFGESAAVPVQVPWDATVRI